MDILIVMKAVHDRTVAQLRRINREDECEDPTVEPTAEIILTAAWEDVPDGAIARDCTRLRADRMAHRAA